MTSGKRASFVVRVIEAKPGQVTGVIERVATGAKEAFSGLDVIGPVIERMLRCEPLGPGTRRPGRS